MTEIKKDLRHWSKFYRNSLFQKLFNMTDREYLQLTVYIQGHRKDFFKGGGGAVVLNATFKKGNV